MPEITKNDMSQIRLTVLYRIQNIVEVHIIKYTLISFGYILRWLKKIQIDCSSLRQRFLTVKQFMQNLPNCQDKFKYEFVWSKINGILIRMKIMPNPKFSHEYL